MLEIRLVYLDIKNILGDFFFFFGMKWRKGCRKLGLRLGVGMEKLVLFVFVGC